MSVRSAVWQAKAGTMLLGGALRGLAQYRADLAFTMLAGAVFQTTGFLTLWVILARFNTIAGWTITEVAVLYGLRLTAHSLWAVPFNQLMRLEEYIREGTFDRFLVRPVNPLVQMMTSRIRLNALGDLIAGLVVLAVGASHVDIDWSAGKAAFLVLAVLGGACLEGAFQLGMSAISFRTLGSRQVRFTVDWLFNLYGNYPSKIFGRVGQWALTVVVPVAFVAYLPTTVLLDRTDELALPAWFAYLSPVIGLAFFVAAYRIWRGQLRHYQGAGS